ncbi:MAG: extracellular solute-binding protein, partial [Desulfobacterales bacterium]|nr:extracellular solute-binding protein [Desulfobacterales bacterium]
ASAERFEKLSKELYPKAQQEGKLIIYTQADVEDVVNLIDAFSKQFPGIKVDYWQSESAQIVTRVLTEFRAGQASVDVVQHDIDALLLKDAGAVAPFESVQKNDLVLSDPTLAIVGMEVQALAYNTKKMKAEDLPKGWEDLANPKYKGIVALDDPMRGGPLTIQLAILKGSWKDDAKWTSFVKGLKALNVPVHRSTGAMFRLLVAGEFSMAEPALLHDLLREREKGSPVDFVKAAPPVVFPDYAVLYAKSPHPNAAKLFIEWLLSPAGQATYYSTGRTPNLKGLDANSSLEKNWSPDVKPLAMIDPAFIKDQKKWMDSNIKPIWEAK